MEELVDLGQPCVDPDDRRRTLGEQVVAEAAAAIHLDQQATEVRDDVCARLDERAPLAAQDAGVRAARCDTCRRIACGGGRAEPSARV